MTKSEQKKGVCSLIITPQSNIYADKDGKAGKYIFNVPVSVLTEEEEKMWNQAALQIYSSVMDQANEEEENGAFSAKNKLIFAWKFALKGMGCFKEYVIFKC